MPEWRKNLTSEITGVEKGINMIFIKVPGLEGKVYVPRTDLSAPKKHPCKDCFSCQMCTNERCKLCRENKDEECIDKSCCKVRHQI
jgi:hypothetical protein